MSKTVFTQYDPSGSWRTEQGHRRLKLFARLYEDKHATLNRRQKNEIPSSETFVIEMKRVSRNLLTDTVLNGRTITYMMNSAIGRDKKTI